MVNPIRFVKAWWKVRSQRDPEKIAQALGRPEHLYLDDTQAEFVEDCFVGVEGKEVIYPPMGPDGVAKEFFRRWPRTEFRYFMAVNEHGDALEYTNGDATQDGIELIQAAMILRGALVEREDGWYYQTWHPMTKRLGEIGSKPVEVKSSRGGIV